MPTLYFILLIREREREKLCSREAATMLTMSSQYIVKVTCVQIRQHLEKREFAYFDSYSYVYI